MHFNPQKLLLTRSGHPSVKHSNTTAAIGVMSVKKTADGVWFNFAHNTDSFVSRVSNISQYKRSTDTCPRL